VGSWIPAAMEVSRCAAEIRQFAMQSDLIVGAVSTSDGTLVAGRERIIPVEVLPPLRIETVNLLASVQHGSGGELAQSYERNAPFADRMNAQHDWAPIFLSPELRDTEYGSLLNITDQLLKSWSNGGRTRYVYFEYPKPSRYPFAQPLYEHLGVNTVVYNWNTSDAAYIVHVSGVAVLGLNRTGAPCQLHPRRDAAGCSAITRSRRRGSGLCVFRRHRRTESRAGRAVRGALPDLLGFRRPERCSRGNRGRIRVQASGEHDRAADCTHHRDQRRTTSRARARRRSDIARAVRR
jgi:hypothetical protein